MKEKHRLLGSHADCTVTGDRTYNLLVYGTMLQPTWPPAEGNWTLLLVAHFLLFLSVHRVQKCCTEIVSYSFFSGNASFQGQPVALDSVDSLGYTSGMVTPQCLS